MDTSNATAERNSNAARCIAMLHRVPCNLRAMLMPSKEGIQVQQGVEEREVRPDQLEDSIMTFVTLGLLN